MWNLSSPTKDWTCIPCNGGGFPVALVEKNLPVSAGDPRGAVLSLGQQDPWRRKWQPSSSILTWRVHVQRSLVGYSLWGLKELDTTKHTHTSPHWKVNSQLLDCQGSPKSFLLWGLNSYNSRGFGLSQTVVCNLETQENQWFSSVQGQRPEN